MRKYVLAAIGSRSQAWSAQRDTTTATEIAVVQAGPRRGLQARGRPVDVFDVSDRRRNRVGRRKSLQNKQSVDAGTPSLRVKVLSGPEKCL